MIELIHIGHSAKSRGTGGKFKARIEDHFKEDALKARALFINLNGSKVPFLLESCEDHGYMIFKVEEINSPEDVSSLLSKELYLDLREVSETALKSTQKTDHPLMNFLVLDQNDSELGKIIEILVYPDQLLAKIVIDKKEILLPIHDDLILDLDEEKKFIKLEIVDGLLDL